MDQTEKELAPGYMGKILRIDLTSKTYKQESLDPGIADLFFGGRGLGVYYLFRHFSVLKATGAYKNPFQEVDPLSPDNVIVLATSPTTGTRMPTSGRMHMNFKSPMTGAYGSTNGGGRFGVDLKKTGHDGVVITGKSQTPVYPIISSRGVEFLEDREMHSLDAIEVREYLKKKTTSKVQVLTIGPGGKKLARFATVLSDTGKALGRGGGGAVWGSKNLYALAVIPDPVIHIETANQGDFKQKNQSISHRVRLKLDAGKFTKKESSFGILPSMGSLGVMGMVDNYHQLIHNNMKDTNHRKEDIEKINGEALRYHFRNAKPGEKKIRVKKGACFNCPIACKRNTTLLDEQGRVIETGEGPEFESATLLGANLSIYDLPTIVQANTLANRYGLDTISLGAAIAAFFELYEMIKNKDNPNSRESQLLKDMGSFEADYGEPGFSKTELLLPLIHLIGKREGIGDHLAQGSLRFCSRYDHPELSMSVKGLDLPAYDPRTSFTQALSYEMSNRGGCHLEGGYTAPQAYCAGYGEWPGQRIEGTPLISKNAGLKNTVLDIIGACAYGSFSLGLDEYAGMVNAVTGQNQNSGTLDILAHRTLTLERLFNGLCGLTYKDDWLPDRFYSEPLHTDDGDFICNRKAFEKMHKEYYDSMGWDESGKPTKEILEKLGLAPFVT
jgi:aldehyde:ferredoxin oxidoreductase